MSLPLGKARLELRQLRFARGGGQRLRLFRAWALLGDPTPRELAHGGRARSGAAAQGEVGVARDHPAAQLLLDQLEAAATTTIRASIRRRDGRLVARIDIRRESEAEGYRDLASRIRTAVRRGIALGVARGQVGSVRARGWSV